MKNKGILLAILYSIVHPIILLFEGGFWLLIPTLVSFFLGLIILFIGLNGQNNSKNPYAIVFGSIPILLFQVVLLL